MIRSFSIQTLGCRVNQYEGEQLAALMRAHGLRQTEPRLADLRIINSCSVTVQAAGKSRQLTRRATADATGEATRSGSSGRRVALEQLRGGDSPPGDPRCESAGGDPEARPGARAMLGPPPGHCGPEIRPTPSPRPRVIVTGCWATSDRHAAASLPGVDAVIGHHDDVAAELVRLLALWQDGEDTAGPRAAPTAGTAGIEGIEPTADQVRGILRNIEVPDPTGPAQHNRPDRDGANDSRHHGLSLPERMPKPCGNDGWIIEKAGAPTGTLAQNKPSAPYNVNGNLAAFAASGGGRRQSDGRARATGNPGAVGTTSLPLLDRRQTGRQRAYLKVQDGCDAHCTYCIIPRLRPRLWSKGVEDAVEEARRLVAAGHVELVLTGIFLGAYGQPTALRRRQPRETIDP